MNLSTVCTIVCLIAGTLVTAAFGLFVSGWLLVKAIDQWGIVFAVSRVIFRKVFWSEVARLKAFPRTAHDLAHDDEECT